MKYLLGKAALMFLISGIVCIAGGVAICLWPEISFTTLTYVFAFSVIIQGSIQFLYGIYRSLEFPWLIVLYLGIINIAVGHFIILYSGLTEMVFMLSIAATWTSTGIITLLLSFYLYKETQKDSWLILSGMFSIAAGCYVFINFYQGIIPLLWVTALYNFLFGTLTVLFGIKARAWSRVYFDDTME